MQPLWVKGERGKTGSKGDEGLLALTRLEELKIALLLDQEAGLLKTEQVKVVSPQTTARAHARRNQPSRVACR